MATDKVLVNAGGDHGGKGATLDIHHRLIFTTSTAVNTVSGPVAMEINDRV